jgi:phage tail-like protein
MTTIGMSAGQKLLNTASMTSLGSYPNYGMSMRFQVVVDDTPVKNLGFWQSCEGLKVDLKYKPIEQGGEYTTSSWLPERITYSPVTLKRAISKANSTTLQTWLQGCISQWITYPSTAGNNTPPFTSVTITLLDYQLNQVMSWTLAQARPAAWQGPSLSADGKSVAIETLVFEHSGFLTVNS